MLSYLKNRTLVLTNIPLTCFLKHVDISAITEEYSRIYEEHLLNSERNSDIILGSHVL